MSPLWTGAAALLLAAAVASITYRQLMVPPVERVLAPEQALALTVSRTLELEAALAQASVWERVLYGMSMQTGLEVLDETIGWYRELARHSSDPLVPLHLAILLGEAGQLDALQELMDSWTEDEVPFSTFARVLRPAYLASALAPAREEELQAELAEMLPAGWFYDTLAIRLAERAGHTAFADSIRAGLLARGGDLLDRLRIFLVLDLGLMAGGAIALLLLLRRMPSAPPLGQAAVPPPWGGATGLRVLIRGAALGVLVWCLLLGLSLADQSVGVLAIPLINLPLLELASRHLFRPQGLSMAAGFGLLPRAASLGSLSLWVITLVGVGLVGEGLLGLLAEFVGWSSHWSEWFDPELVWSDSDTLALTLVEYVVFAPVFEELVFRGLLFPTLRRSLGFASAALLSATLFGLAHGYGVLGLMSVIWSGVLWAWAYERTGSVLPGMLAHATNNLIVCLTVMAMLR